MDGIICINKPEGFTSFDVIAKMRGMLRMKKIGHAGTLDPMATGVLPVFLGRATRASDFILAGDKTYRAQVRFGVITDTQDRTGEIVGKSDLRISRAQLEQILPRFCGELDQIPPMYSAISIGGRRLYDIARSGETVERKPRRVTVYRLDLLGFDEAAQSAVLEVDCSKGTYIRALCHDIGQALGCGAMLDELCRERAAGFTLDDCITLDKLQEICAEEAKVQEHLVPLERIFEGYPSVHLNTAQAVHFKNGVQLTLKETLLPNILYRVYGPDEFLGLGEKMEQGNRIKVKKMFAGRE